MGPLLKAALLSLAIVAVALPAQAKTEEKPFGLGIFNTVTPDTALTEAGQQGQDLPAYGAIDVGFGAPAVSVNWATGNPGFLDAVNASVTWNLRPVYDKRPENGKLKYVPMSWWSMQFGLIVGKDQERPFDFGLVYAPYVFRYDKFSIGAGLALRTYNGSFDVKLQNWNWYFPATFNF